ncbi:hypothetical protein LXL04_007698 [Taraxacum kok-saghyz]
MTWALKSIHVDSAEPKPSYQAKLYRTEVPNPVKPNRSAEPNQSAEPKPFCQAKPKPSCQAEPRCRTQPKCRTEAFLSSRTEVPNPTKVSNRSLSVKPNRSAEPNQSAEPKPSYQAEPKPSCQAEPKPSCQAEPKCRTMSRNIGFEPNRRTTSNQTISNRSRITEAEPPRLSGIVALKKRNNVLDANREIVELDAIFGSFNFRLELYVIRNKEEDKHGGGGEDGQYTTDPARFSATHFGLTQFGTNHIWFFPGIHRVVPYKFRKTSSEDFFQTLTIYFSIIRPVLLSYVNQSLATFRKILQTIQNITRIQRRPGKRERTLSFYISFYISLTYEKHHRHLPDRRIRPLSHNTNLIVGAFSGGIRPRGTF